MAEGIDTSSYPRPQVQPNVLDTVAKFGSLQQQKQQIESGAITIDKQKLDIANQAMGVLTRALTAIGPNGTKEQYLKAGEDVAIQFKLPPQMQQVWVDKIKAAPSSKAFYDEAVTQLASHGEMINYHIGQQGFANSGQQIIPYRAPGSGGITQNAPGIQIQPPPTTEIPTEGGVQQLGVATLPGSSGLPVAPFPGARTAPGGVTAGPGGSNAPNPMQPSGPITGRPPAYDKGLEARNSDQQIALERATAVKPALQVLPLLEGLRSGPGTEPWTKAVAFLKANNIISTEQENDPTVIRQIVDKKLAQYVGGSPLSSRSDAGQALAEAGSPTAKVQLNPALEKLTKDAIALDRLRIALPGAFQGKDFSQYGSHRATFPTSMDERAFSLDLMKDSERKALVNRMGQQLLSKDAKEKANAEKFFKSLEIAKAHGIY